MTFLADSWSDSPIGSRLQLGLSVRISISFRVRFPHALLCQTDELWLPCEKVCLQNDLGTHWRQLEVAYIEPIWNLDFLNFNLNHALEIGYALNLIESNTYHYKVLFFDYSTSLELEIQPNIYCLKICAQKSFSQNAWPIRVIYIQGKRLCHEVFKHFFSLNFAKKITVHFYCYTRFWKFFVSMKRKQSKIYSLFPNVQNRGFIM